jgi:AraC-like DNA-binding protein
MNDSLILSDALVRGVTLGAVATTGMGLMRGEVSWDVRLSGLLLSVSLCAWTITQSPTLWSALGNAYVVVLVAYPLGGFFWLFVSVVFADRPVSALTLLPAAALIGIGLGVSLLIPSPVREWVWAVRNMAVAVLLLHAGLVIARGWGGDLLTARRQARGVLLSLAALYGVVEAILVVGSRFRQFGGWMLISAGQPVGGLIVAGISLAAATLLLQTRTSMFVAGSRPEGADARAEAADREDLARLEALMTAEHWRREGLLIGQLAQELDLPEHRLRRLINGRLGYRNFADFLNTYRVEAAKQRLASAALARTTVAAIAFDLGYGSLGPFNRAFRSATGATPTEWRRRALAEIANAS